MHVVLDVFATHNSLLLMIIADSYCMLFGGTLAAVHLRVLEATRLK